MKQLFALLLMSIITATAIAQDKTQEQKNAEQLAAYKKSEDAQKALNEKKADAIAKMDNKDPKPIKDDAQRHRMELLQARALLDQQKLETMQVAIKAALAQPIANAQASAKAYNDAVAEAQKQYHAEGCQIVYDEKGDIKVSKDGKEVWDCSKVGK